MVFLVLYLRHKIWIISFHNDVNTEWMQLTLHFEGQGVLMQKSKSLFLLKRNDLKYSRLGSFEIYEHLFCLVFSNINQPLELLSTQ